MARYMEVTTCILQDARHSAVIEHYNIDSNLKRCVAAKWLARESFPLIINGSILALETVEVGLVFAKYE